MRPLAVKRLLTGTLILFLLALGLGLGFNAVNPVGQRLPLIPAYTLHTPYRLISLDRAAETFLAQKFYLWRTWGGGPVLFLDARARLEWKDHRIPGAMLMYPLSYVVLSCDKKTGRCKEERNDYFGRVLYPFTPAFKDKKLPLIVYGRTLFYNLAAELAWRLHQRGHNNIRLLEASLADWRAAGLPIYGPQLTGPK